MAIPFKICGLKEAKHVEAAVGSGARWVGFIHFPASPRHVSVSEAAALAASLPASTQAVSVTVDADDDALRTLFAAYSPPLLQLHGNESPQRLAAIRGQWPEVKLIKAFRIRSADDVAVAHAFAESADFYLFDARAPEHALPGGNGLAFDWTLLQGRSFKRPWLLSGGLNAENLASAVRTTGASMVDVSSGVERAPGVKDAALINVFAKAAASI